MAMVLFGSRVTQVIGFEDSHKGLSHVQEKIMSVKHRREGMTSTATALNFVKEAILGKVRMITTTTSILYAFWSCVHLFKEYTT